MHCPVSLDLCPHVDSSRSLPDIVYNHGRSIGKLTETSSESRTVRSRVYNYQRIESRVRTFTVTQLWESSFEVTSYSQPPNYGVEGVENHVFRTRHEVYHGSFRNCPNSGQRVLFLNKPVEGREDDTRLTQGRF